jgi:hypothetical protein
MTMATVGFALPVTAAPPPPPPAFTCTGSAAAIQSVPGGVFSSFTMPAGTACQVTGLVQVLAPLTLGTGSLLLVKVGGLTVEGGVDVQSQAVFGADVGKTEKAPVTIVGSVTVNNDGVFFLGTEIPYGPVFATVQGRVKGYNPSAVVIQNTAIGGSVNISGGGAVNKIIQSAFGPDGNYTDFEDDHVGGSISEVGYGGVWGGVIRSVIRGSLSFAYNSQQKIDEYDIGSDVIYRSAFCQGNDPAPNLGSSSGSPSLVKGRTFGDQAKTCTGVPTGGTGPLPPH